MSTFMFKHENQNGTFESEGKASTLPECHELVVKQYGRLLMYLV